MKIAVLGAGAIGCYFGGVLARIQEDVTFIARGRTLDALSDHGLSVKSIHGDFSLPVKVADAEHLPEHPDFDIVLLTIKSTTLADTLPELKTLVRPNTKIVCMLNGIGNEEKLSETFGAKRVAGASAFISVIREAPGVVNHVGAGTLVIGEWDTAGDADGKLIHLEEAFNAAGVQTTVSENIRRVKWEKLLWNIIFNPLTALTETKVGDARKDPDLFQVMERVKFEFLNLCAAAGIVIRQQLIDNVLRPNKDVDNHKTSMLQDLEHGRKMELEAILGFTVYVARQHQVEVPTIENVYHLLAFKERRRLGTQKKVGQ